MLELCRGRDICIKTDVIPKDIYLTRKQLEVLDLEKICLQSSCKIFYSKSAEEVGSFILADIGMFFSMRNKEAFPLRWMDHLICS